MKIINFAFKHKEIVYNLGATSSYIAQMCYLSHGINMLISRSKPHWSITGHVVFTLTAMILMAPYKWDRKWMRVKSMVGMSIFGSVLLIYLLCAIGL
tara:strand:+ start:266 stop:556 length:291 start_codon:yes stop_codon:yes gene_type:complete